ncbi:hypothetical protein OY671_009245, partial [Metschnikowia pulcherrima]
NKFVGSFERNVLSAGRRSRDKGVSIGKREIEEVSLAESAPRYAESIAQEPSELPAPPPVDPEDDIAATAGVSAGCDRAAPEQQAPVAAPPAEAASDPAEASATPEPEPSSALSPSPTPSPTPKEARYAPREDCDKAPGWKAFRGRSATAVTARDAGASAASADPNIRLDYGGGSGADELKKRSADPKAGSWQESDRISPLGCS